MFRFLLLPALLFAAPAIAQDTSKCEPFTGFLEDPNVKSGGDAVSDMGVGNVTAFAEDQTVLGFQSVTTVVAPGAKADERRLIVNAYLTLGDNQIIYGGTYPAPGEADSVPSFETKLAVLGGTGTFNGASGQVSFVTEDGRRAAKFVITCPS